MRTLLLCVVLGACGRIDFAATPDAMPDADTRCPANLVFVTGNAALGTTDFCVMAFEAKARDLVTGEVSATGCDASCIATHGAASVPEGHPWIQIEAEAAFAECRSLGPGYDLMSNREWMTIARDAELVGANWSSGTPGIGRLVEGTTDFAPTGPVSDVTDPYSDSGGNSAADPPGAGWEQRRTLVLSSGDVIWDLPGHVQEWIDWTLGGLLDGAPTPCTNAELTAFACAGIGDDDFNSSTRTYDSTHGAGFIIGGAGNATRRGGQNTDLPNRLAGIYALNMNRFQTGEIFVATGFRCVLRL